MKWPVSQPCLLLVTDEQLLDLGTELLYELSILLKIIPVLNTFNCISLAVGESRQTENYLCTTSGQWCFDERKNNCAVI